MRLSTFSVSPSAASFVRDQRGGVAIIFAFCIVMLAAMVGGAVDFARFYQMTSTFRSAVDTATLAGARVKQTGGSDADALTAAKSYLDDVKSRHAVEGEIEFKVADSGTAVQASGTLSMRTSFLPVIKLDKLPFGVASTARFGMGSNVELSLMLDITGSMSGSKIADLKYAVEDLIGIVVRDDGDERSRIALAPFSNSIKLKSKQYTGATGQDANGKLCVVERAGAQAYTDAAPDAGSYVTALSDVAPGAWCKDSGEIIPLSNRKSDLKAFVKGLAAGGATAGHLGTAWAWYLLSPNWADIYEPSERPGPYADVTTKDAAGNPKLRKIAVLMTDGEYNTEYVGADSTTQARAICAEMKKTGIEVFTIGFEVGGSRTVLETLQGCASSPSHFYEASSGDALKSAFRDIALKSTPLRISK